MSLNKTLLTFLIVCLFGAKNMYSQSESQKIETLITSKKNFNKENKNSTIYRIQLYNGSESKAYKIKRNFEIAFPEYTAKIIYKAPEWKTQVGSFRTRLEADRILKVINEKFTGAFVLEDKI